MRGLTSIWVALALCMLVASTSRAQRGNASPRGAGTCRVDSAAAWYKRQRVWFDDTAHRWSNDTLRLSLLRAAGLSEASPIEVQWGWTIIGEGPGASGDSVMVGSLLGLARTRGSSWPTKTVVGAAGTHAVALLALRDTALGRTALRRMMEAGPDESPPADVALLEDRIRLISGRKQIYGTQFQRTDKGLVLSPMEDSTHVDLRREDAGLPPFTLSACLARAAAPRP